MELLDIPYWEYFEQGMRRDWELCEVWYDWDYSGSAAVLGRTPGTETYFWVEWGWGTCSGCDSWQEDGIEPSVIVVGIWETNAPTTLKEFREYVDSQDLKLVWRKEQ